VQIVPAPDGASALRAARSAPEALLGLGEPPAFGARDPVALEVALGAWRALAHVRRAALCPEAKA
jgi:hypothetical protein